MDYTQIIVSVISLIVAILTGVLVPYLKQKYGETKNRSDTAICRYCSQSRRTTVQNRTSTREKGICCQLSV